jgi:ribosomal protein L37E
MRLLDVLTDGGTEPEYDRHFECRRCGENLSPRAAECPICGGEVAVHTLG